MPTLTASVPVLPVANLEVALEHYSGALGFETTYSWPQDGPRTYAILRRDEASLHLSQHEHVNPGIAYIFVEGLRDLHLAWRAKGFTFARDVESFDYGMTEFEIRDADGNVLVFAEST
jgi:catechol 2,3-dioxygenase-like lactoylglutathione lyase family enzyme